MKLMRRKGIREGLVKRIERVRAERKIGEGFWTARGMRQKCSLNLLLFILMADVIMTDIEKEMGKVKWGEIKIRRRRVYSLHYADNMVLMAERVEKIRSIEERLEEYLDRKGLEVNTEKTKIIRFRKRGRKVSKKN